jgi:inosine-uridine nucleoside N-ribohydrolase
VVTTHAPGLKPAGAADAARAWLDALPGARKPAVVAGSAIPLADRRSPRPNPGVDLILSESRKAVEGRKVIVFVIGAATDMASALLIDPALSERVDVFAMGFSRWPEGGDPWNVKNDVHAWQALLDSRVPIVVGDEDVCKRCLAMSTAEAHRLFDAGGAPARAIIGVLDARLKANREQAEKTTGNPNEWPIWDEVTVAHLLGLTEVDVKPRPRLRDDLTFDHSAPRGTIGWVRSLNTRALWDDLAGCLRSKP